MRKIIILCACAASLTILYGCQPTIAVISVSETVNPNGEKTVTTTKTLSQQFGHTQTGSTDQILEKFK
jgi:phosphotransacetylase